MTTRPTAFRSAWLEVEGPVEDLTEGGRCGIERSSRRSFPLRHVTSDSSPDCCGSEAAGNTATRISSSNHPCFRRYLPIFRSLRPVGSAQVGLGRPSVECGLVGCSWRWWNDYQNDQQCKLGWVQEERTAPTSRVGVGWRRRSCEVEQVAHGSSVAEPCHGAWSATFDSGHEIWTPLTALAAGEWGFRRNVRFRTADL